MKTAAIMLQTAGAGLVVAGFFALFGLIGGLLAGGLTVFAAGVALEHGI